MDLVEILNDPANVAGGLMALALFATILTLAAPMMRADKLAARMKSVKEARSELRRKNRQALAQSPAGLRIRDEGFVKRVVSQLNLRKLLADDTIDVKMMRAGLRGTKPVNTFYFFRAAAPIGLGVFAFVITMVFGDQWQMTSQGRLLLVAAGVALGFYGPNLYVTNLIQKRQQSIMRAFPDALDMLLICVEAGMSVEVAMGRVGQEMGVISIELAEEFALCTAELSYLPERRQAYDNLAKRTNHPGVKAVTMALTQAERYGTPLGQALRVMAKENRDMRMADAEKKAAALPAKLTVPMIAFFLPVLCAVIVAPALIQVAETMAKNGR